VNLQLYFAQLSSLIPLSIWVDCHLETQRLSGWIMIRKKTEKPKFH